MQPGWCQPVRQEFTENECEALPGVAYPGVRDNRSTLNTKTGYNDDELQVCKCWWCAGRIAVHHVTKSVCTVLMEIMHKFCHIISFVL